MAAKEAKRVTAVATAGIGSVTWGFGLVILEGSLIRRRLHLMRTLGWPPATESLAQRRPSDLELRERSQGDAGWAARSGER